MSNQGQGYGNLRVISGNKQHENEPLQTTYYCQAEKRKILDVVIELKGSTETCDSLIPQRFVLVIDVSGSMGGTVHVEDSLSLLDRMKIFAKRFVETTTQINWLSIVAFSNQAVVLLPMTQMNEDGKNIAKMVIGSLQPGGGTNISEGLFGGLYLAAGSYQGYGTHDCIILFTDGEANDGICDSFLLINEYLQRMQQYKQTGRINNVQLAAITIDGYEPRLLSEIRKELSSDAFYVLNLDCDFEADMLIPLFLRQSSCITDINLDLNCLEGVTFNPHHTFKPGLVGENGNLFRRYFFYTLPESVVKHVYVSLDISRLSSDKNVILRVNKAYLDPSLQPRSSEEHLQLDLTTMKQARDNANVSKELNSADLVLLENTSAYISSGSELLVTWESAQLAFANVLKQKGRLTSYSTIEESSAYVFENRKGAAAKQLSQSISKIKDFQNTGKSVLGEKSVLSRLLYNNLNNYAKNLEYGKVNIESMSWARFQAMLSSIETEMPTATGVFEPESSQPFMPPQIEEKLVENTKIMNDQKGSSAQNEYWERRLKQDQAKKQLNDAISNRHLEMIQKALNNCMFYGVDETTLLKAERFIEIVEKEDILIKEINLALRKSDIPAMQKAIETFRVPESQFVDKTGIVKKAEKHVHDVLERQKLLKLKEDTLQKLKTARKEGRDAEMEKRIKELETPPLRDVVDAMVVMEARDDLNRLRRELSLGTHVNNLIKDVNQLILAEDLLALEKKLDELRHVTKDKNYKKNEETENFIKTSFDALEVLRKKHRLRDELKKAWKGFELPLIPDSLASLKASIAAVEELKKQAQKYDGGFTATDEEKLQKHTQEVEDLEIKIKSRDKANQSLTDAFNSRDYEELKSVLRQTQKLSFLDEDLVQKCKDLRDFLNPKKRREALLNASKSRDIEELEKAISDFKAANVTQYLDDLKKAEKRLKKLKRIEKFNKELREAMIEQDVPRLRKALQQCEESKINQNDIPLYQEAKDLLFELIVEELKENLQEAIASRNLLKLAEALKQIDESGYLYRLADEYEKGKELFEKLLELHRLKEKILLMDDSVVSEIKNYTKPPVLVKTVMSAVFLLLGETAQTANNWSNVQKLMKQTAAKPMKKRIQNCMPQNVDAALRKKVDKYLNDLDVETIETTSKGVATFFAWLKCMLAESEYFNSD